MSVEIEPYFVYRFVGSNVEFAMWRLTDGQRALALFQTAEAAHAYRAAVPLGDEWLVLRPKRPALLELLRATHQAGVRFAVLDPDREKAKSVFDLTAIVEASGSEEAPQT
jgi:hypothetical protein